MIEFHGDLLLKKYCRPGFEMLELGNQIMNLEEVQNISAKHYYSHSMGVRHTSVDQNGLNGALELDLSGPVVLDKTFDIITDFGTSEHVENLFWCLTNVLAHAKAGTVMIHKNPLTGNFPGHGFHFFTVEFWRAYAEVCNLEVLELFTYPIYGNITDGFETIAILRFTNQSRLWTSGEFECIRHLVKSK